MNTPGSDWEKRELQSPPKDEFPTLSNLI